MITDEQFNELFPKDKVIIKCTYFKRTGKYYTSGVGMFDREIFEGCLCPSDYGRRLRERGNLPGINSTGTAFITLVEVYGMYAELLLPVQP